jgi:hypothetical protein
MGRSVEPPNVDAAIEVVLLQVARVNHISAELGRSQGRVACLIET